ncbi:MAG: NAD-dependent epimerase/dehydratase family protein [Acutalibacter sp.]|jgi:nucleoside-diphosphate-sugar epimerase
MKAVVIGAAGHIGTYLIPMLVKAGFETVAITRTMYQPYQQDYAWNSAERVLMDRSQEDFLPKLKAMKPDVLVDLVNFDVEDTRKLVKEFQGTSLSHYLYCSSCWGHGRAEVLPFDPDALRKEPIDAYGQDKYASELLLKEAYRTSGFPATMVLPGQISGPGWTIINPWGNTSMRVIQDIADGKEIALPNFGMEILHHVHGYDVAQMFFRAITHRNAALGEAFDAEAAEHVTTYGYARHLYQFFGKEPKIQFLDWKEWCAYEGDPEECQQSYLHLARSGTFSIEKAKLLLEYQPKYTVLETIDLAMQSYLDRGVIRV